MPDSDSTITRSFRLRYTQHTLLNNGVYKDNASLLIRMLLDTFFAGALPQVEQDFKHTISAKGK